MHRTVLCGNFRTTLNILPGCNAAGFWDRLILRPEHMYTNPTYANLAECQVVPDSARPLWCSYPFEAEGIVSTMSAVVTVIFGCYSAQVLLAMQASGASGVDKLWQWLPLSVVGIAVGLLLHFTNLIPMNKNLWSISYLLVTTGIAGILYAFLHVTLDKPPAPEQQPASWEPSAQGSMQAPPPGIPVPFLSKLVAPFKWMGGNSIFFFVAHEVYERILVMIYNGRLVRNLDASLAPFLIPCHLCHTRYIWGAFESHLRSNAAQDNNLFVAHERLFAQITRVSGEECSDNRRCIMILVCARLVMWFVLAGFLHKIKWRWII